MEVALVFLGSLVLAVAAWILPSRFTPLSKPLKTKQLAEKARSKYPEREQKTIGVGVFRFKTLAAEAGRQVRSACRPRSRTHFTDYRGAFNRSMQHHLM